MQTFHHIGIAGEDLVTVEELRRIGIDVTPYTDSISEGPLYFEMSEDDPRWKDVERLLRDYRAGKTRIFDRAWTVFTQKERDEAEFLRVGTCWTHGYPEPSDIESLPVGARELPYLAATYDLTDFCPVCRSGARQNGLFRMKTPPPWGRRSVMRLHWIEDELFVKPDVWAAIFEPFGVKKRPVLLHKTGQEIDSVVQLIISGEVQLRLEGLPYEVCPRCGRKKYLPICRGFFPPPIGDVPSISKSQEYFGFDTAFKEILVARDLYRKILGAGLKGIEFQPYAAKSEGEQKRGKERKRDGKEGKPEI